MQIQLNNIYKSYSSSPQKPKQEVLKGLNLTLETGSRMAIMGPSGSGKTSLLNIIGTLDHADEGEVLFDQFNVSQFNDSALNEFRNQKIGFVFQSHHLLPQLTALDNILLPTLVFSNKSEKQQAHQRALDWLHKFELESATYKFPSQLSGGESQRVAVIRALINQPEILLADEPTGSLDAKSSENLANLLIDISKQENISLLIVTHSLKLAQKIGEIKELSDGILRD